MAIPRPVRTALTATCNGYVASPEQIEAERREAERIEAERQAEAESTDTPPPPWTTSSVGA